MSLKYYFVIICGIFLLENNHPVESLQSFFRGYLNPDTNLRLSSYSKTIKEDYFTQPLDHFDVTSNKTWNQVYNLN